MKKVRNIRWWMLIYTLAIGLLFGVSTVISRHQPRPHYPIAYEIFENVAVILMFAGNLLYAFGYVTPLLRKLWKFVFPLVIASVVASALVTPHFDSTFQKHGPVAHIVTWILVVGIFFASFRANFLI